MAQPGWQEIAFSAEVVRRSLLYAVVVGGILVAINHGDILLAGRFSEAQWVKIILTPLVPYLVCTFSCVQAIRSLPSPDNPQTD